MQKKGSRRTGLTGDGSIVISNSKGRNASLAQAHRTLHPEDCPRFNRCGANICPLDDDWPLRTHLKGECVCFYLTEAVKPGGAARVRGITATELAEKILAALPRIMARYGPIRRALARSAKTGPRLGRRVGVPKRKAAA